MSQHKSFFHRLNFPTTASISSASSESSTSSRPVRAYYTRDNCGHDLSYRYSERNPSESPTVSDPPFRRAAYTMDGQGYDLSYKYPCTLLRGEDGEVTSNHDWVVEQKGFRSLYTLDWKPFTFFHRA
jgi:hypothetical protein